MVVLWVKTIKPYIVLEVYVCLNRLTQSDVKYKPFKHLPLFDNVHL